MRSIHYPIDRVLKLFWPIIGKLHCSIHYPIDRVLKRGKGCGSSIHYPIDRVLKRCMAARRVEFSSIHYPIDRVLKLQHLS